MDLPINGPAYIHPSQDVNNQERINLFLSPSGPQGLDDGTKFVLLPTAGKKLMVNLGGNEVRAIMNINNVVYAVVDSTVYKLTINDDAGTATGASIGTISTSSSGPIYWAKNPTQVMLVDGTATGGYIITQATDTLAIITDTDFTGAETVVFMDSYFLYNTPDASTIYATASNNGSSVSALDVTTAEGAPDLLVGLAVDKRELWAFGAETVEIYYDAANATGFPFTRREGAFIDIGCAAAGSILNFDNTLVWLDNRGFIVRAENYTPTVISSPAISAAIRSYETVSDARAFQQVDRGSMFYIITFPTAKKTWAYDAVTQQWHERAYWSQDDTFEHDLINCQTRYKQWDLIGLRNSGKICILDKDTYTDAGDPIHRLNKTSHQQVDMTIVSVDELELQLETGKAAATDNEPYAQLRYSNDGGYSWSQELPRSIGNIGNYSKSVRWNRLGSARKWLFEFRFVIPQRFSIIKANIGISGEQ